MDLDMASNPTIYVTDFGADPSGLTDSYPAFKAAIEALTSRNVSGHQLASGMADLGGATLDLEGGDYLVSSPIIFPGGYANYHVQRGTIRAGPGFPADSYVIVVGDPTCVGQGNNDCVEDAGFEDLLIDGQQLAAGGIAIYATMGANIGPQIFILNFYSAGITVHGSHEVMIHESWLGEYIYSDPRSHLPNNTATGIQLLGNDHFITNTIVFSGLIGIEVAGAANLITGAHTWNLDSAQGGIGIYVNAPGYTQNRLVGCYLDYNSIVAIAPEHLTIVDGFFLCAGNIVIAAEPGNTVINGLIIKDNQFDLCGNDSVMIDERLAKFTSAMDVFISDNLLSPEYTLKSMEAFAQFFQENATQWVFDFSSQLLLDTINFIDYSVQFSQGFAMHTSRPPVGNTVMIETNVPMTGTVFVRVAQANSSHPLLP